jgi:hypothetical protein
MATPMSDADLDAVAERLAADIANGDHFPAWLSKSLDLEGALARFASCTAAWKRASSGWRGGRGG